MRKIILYAIVAFSSGLFFTNIYNSIVNAANWESNIPDSIVATRAFFTVANPGTFFQLIDPTNIVLIMVALLVYWKRSTTIRSYLGIALLCFVGCMVLTFSFFYPRNEILFISNEIANVEILKKAASEWGTMNWVRSMIWLIGLVFSFLALNKASNNQN